MGRTRKSEFSEEATTFFLDQLKGHPAIWLKSHKDYKDTRGKVKNDWESIKTAMQRAFDHEQLRAVRMHTIDDLKAVYRSKTYCFKEAVRKARKSGSSLNEAALAMQAGDSRMRFLSANMEGTSGLSNLILPPADPELPRELSIGEFNAAGYDAELLESPSKISGHHDYEPSSPIGPRIQANEAAGHSGEDKDPDASLVSPNRLLFRSVVKSPVRKKSKHWDENPHQANQRALMLKTSSENLLKATATANQGEKKDDEWSIMGNLLAARLRNCTSDEKREQVMEDHIFPALSALKRC